MQDGTVVVTVKDPAERRFERATMATLVVWLGVMMIVKEPHGLTQLGAGAILLVSALYQRFRRWHASIITWVVGALLLGTGIGDLSSKADVPWFGIAIVLAGLWLFTRAVRRPA